MQQTHDSFWDIPEHVLHLAQFLDKNQLATASAVCKNWNTIFTPFLYSDIAWLPDRNGKVPPEDVLQAHAHQVRSFRIEGPFPDFSLTLLRKLIVDTISILNTNSHQRFLIQVANLISQNSRLQSVEVDMIFWSIGEELRIVDLLSQCKHLQELTIQFKFFKKTIVQQILQLSTRLRSLNIHAIHAEPINPSDHLSSSLEMEKLALDIKLGMTLSEQFDIIRRFPQLNRLRWFFGSHPNLTQDIHEAFSDCRLPVKELTLSHQPQFSGRHHLPDESLIRIVESCPEITSLSTDGIDFGPLTFQSLKRRFDNLTQLKVIYSPAMTSSMVQEIMASCPHLLALAAVPLDACDILGIVEGDSVAGNGGEGESLLFQPREWICLKLTSFKVPLYGFKEKPVEWHRQVLQQLSRLERLEYLAIGHSGSYMIDIDDGLHFRLESGLDILGSLKRLECFGFEGGGQHMDEQDIRWMMQNWPLLRKVYGIERGALFEEILTKGGIETHRSEPWCWTVLIQ